MQSKEIMIFNRTNFEEKLDKLNRKAAKLGFSPIVADYLGSDILVVETEEGRRKFVYFAYRIMSDILKLSDSWTLVAALDHVENLINCIPGYTLPEQYKDLVAHCDHCKINRQRSKTYILVNQAGAYTQVGSTCLGDFLGIDPSQLLGQLLIIRDFADLEDDYRKASHCAYDLDAFLAMTNYVIRHYGYISKSKACDVGYTSTADRVWDLLLDRNDSPSQEDTELAKSVIAWGKQLAENGLSDYLANLRQIAINGHVTKRSYGYAASMIQAYLKDQAKPASNSSWLGKEGEKITFSGILVRSSGYASDYGYQFFHKFVDQSGNILVWKTATELSQGKTYQLTGKIKKLDAFNGEKQTMITRPNYKQLD